MILNRSILLSIFFFICIIVNAQNPGYRGKRFVLSYEVSGMPFMGYLSGNEHAWDFNFRSGLRLECAVRKNLSLGLRYERVDDIVQIKNWSTSAQDPFDELVNGPNDNPVAEFMSDAHFSGKNYGVFAKLYNYRNFGSIAPLGTYLGCEFMVNRISIYDDGRYYNSDQEELHYINTNTFVLTTGVQYIYFNHLTFDISLNCGFNKVGTNALDAFDKLIGGYDSEQERKHPFQSTEVKMFSDYILFTRVGVGWLLF